MENIKEYLYIYEIANCGSITHAAKKLGVSQPFLSEYLKCLEKKLNCSLFDRNRKPLIPTIEGELFCKSAKKILEEETFLLNSLKRINLKKNNSLKIGISSSRAKFYLDKYISRFLKIENRCVSLFEIKNEEALSLLNGNKADIVVHFDSLISQNIRSIKLGIEKLYLVYSKKMGEIDLNKAPRIVLKKGQKIREVLDDICKGDIVIECEHIDTAFKYCISGIGVTIVPEYIINKNADSDLVITPILEEKYQRDIFVSWVEKNEILDCFKEFIGLLEEKYDE